MKSSMKALLVVMLIPLMGSAQDCIDYGGYLHWAGEVDSPGVAIGVAISGTHAYLADSSTAVAR